MKQLTRLKITNLFGRRNYDIDFAAKKGFTFLAGPNGYGKSTILKLIYAISKGNFFIFDEIRFDYLEVDFVEGEKKAKLCVEKRNGRDAQNGTSNIFDDPELKKIQDDMLYANRQIQQCHNGLDDLKKIFEDGDISRDKYDAMKLDYQMAIDKYEKSKEFIQQRMEIVKKKKIANGFSDVFLATDVIYECFVSFVDVDGKRHKGSFIDKDIQTVARHVELRGNLRIEDVHYRGRNWTEDSAHRSRESLSELFFKYAGKGKSYELLCMVPQLEFFSRVCFKCIYVGANRQSSVDVVSDYIRRTAEQLKKKNAELSQSLDVSLLSNILQGLQKSKKDAEELRDEVDTKLVLFRSLNEMCEKVGFAYEDKGKESVFKMENLPTDSSSLVVMDLVVSNANEKLDVYTDFASRLEYFEESINKIVNDIEIKVTVDGVKSYVIEEDVPPQDRELPLSKLSSGEQQLIAVLGEMLFDIDFADINRGGIIAQFKQLFSENPEERIREKTLILVDEPEISMHPAWQEALSKLYFEIQDRYGKEFIIATHSPAFIGERWDKVVDLLG